jgi:hypothetical protein
MTRNKMLTGALMTLMLACGGCPLDGGWGCGSSDPNQTEASLYVTDARTGLIISDPTFLTGDTQMDGNCASANPGAVPQVCESFVLVLPPASYHVTVGAPGYRSTEVVIDTTTDKSVHLAVALTPVPDERFKADPAGDTISANP